MRQDFSNVTEDKLAELFPILLEEHNPEWKEFYLQEKDFLQSIFRDKIIRINHIGSSSVAGLIAKPTIDILLEVSEDIDLQSITEKMKDGGYIVNTPKSDIIMYLKGYTPQGFQGQAVHIHVRHSGDWGELYFRDYLILHPDVAAEYVKLKLKLKEQYPHNRDEYTEAKGKFVQKHTEQARAEFPGRYILTVGVFLIEPNKEYQKSFENYVSAYRKINDEHYLNKYKKALENFQDYLNDIYNYSKGYDLPQGEVITSTFWLIDKTEVVGVVRIRHEEVGTAGHIGYDISPDFRNKGYGNLILKLALEKAAKIGTKEVVLTCNINNTASKKIIENNNGKLLSTIYDEEEDEYLYKYIITLPNDQL